MHGYLLIANDNKTHTFNLIQQCIYLIFRLCNMIFSWTNPWRKRARLTRVSPNGCTDNGLVISRDRFFHNTIVTSADIFSANGHYPNVPACFISSKGNDISSPFLPKWNYSVATSILHVCWSRVCPFICTDWRSLTGPVGLKNKYIYGQSWKVLKNMKSCYLNRI